MKPESQEQFFDDVFVASAHRSRCLSFLHVNCLKHKEKIQIERNFNIGWSGGEIKFYAARITYSME